MFGSLYFILIKYQLRCQVSNESEVTCGQVWWPILGICALHLTHPSEHTQQWTHTHTPWTHTRSSWQPMLRRPGSSWGFGALLKGLISSHGIEGGERWSFITPTDNSCQTWDSNPRPLGYKSDYLSIRPRLPQNWCVLCVCVCVCVCVCFVCVRSGAITTAESTLNTYCLINNASLYKGLLLFVYTHNENKTDFIYIYIYIYNIM